MKIVVTITGATGAIYGVRLLEVLKNLDVETHLVMSKWASRTIELETNYRPEEVFQLASHYYDYQDQAATISSGSFKHQGMVIVPCSMKTLAAVTHGFADNLIHRAADVSLKEKRKLILAVRETPLNAIHLENMLKIAQLGAVIMPPMPAFYNKPQTLPDIVNHTVGRILDHLDLEHSLYKTWEECEKSSPRC